MMSWWIGKDRDALNLAVQERANRVMRHETPAPVSQSVTASLIVQEVVPKVVTVEVMAPAVPLATAYAKQKAYRARNVAAGKCARCGQQRHLYSQLCDACQAKVGVRRGLKAWRPGSCGQAPRTVQPFLEMADSVRAAILKSDDGQSDPLMARAGIVMWAGFLFRQRLDWIVGWTRFDRRECRRVVERLRAYGIWLDDGKIACQWMEATERRKRTKQERFELELAFWLDAAVAKGDLTRETRAGEFYYGLPEWERTREP